MPIEIEARLQHQPNIERLLEDAIEAAPDAFGEEAVDVLEGAASLWPVGTGRSRGSFGYVLRGDRVTIENTARSASSGFPTRSWWKAAHGPLSALCGPSTTP